jgi:hypothetical protein
LYRAKRAGSVSVRPRDNPGLGARSGSHVELDAEDRGRERMARRGARLRDKHAVEDLGDEVLRHREEVRARLLHGSSLIELRSMDSPLKWEELANTFTGPKESWPDVPVTRRAAIPGGWLVMLGGADARGTFVPDPEHRWLSDPG